MRSFCHNPTLPYCSPERKIIQQISVSETCWHWVYVKIPWSHEIPFKMSPKCPQSPTSATLLCCQIIIELIAKYPQHGTWSPSLNYNLAMEPPECCDIASGGGIKKRHRCLLLNVISGELVVTAVINLRMCRWDQICLSNTPVLSRVNLIWLVAHVVKSVQEKL